MSESTIRIKLLNNQGAGFAEMHTVSAGTSVGDFFTDKVGGDSERYKITMNGEPVTFAKMRLYTVFNACQIDWAITHQVTYLFL